MLNLKDHIREIPDFPKKGINFKDITPLLENKDAFHKTIDELCKPYEDKKIDKIVGIDARGFILAAAMAYKLNTGLAIIRKAGKLPYKTKQKEYDLEYASEVIEMHEDSVKSGENIVIADDLLATGGTMAATVELVAGTGANILGISFIIALKFLKGDEKLGNYPIHTLIEY